MAAAVLEPNHWPRMDPVAAEGRTTRRKNHLKSRIKICINMVFELDRSFLAFPNGILSFWNFKEEKIHLVCNRNGVLDNFLTRRADLEVMRYAFSKEPRTKHPEAL